MEIKNIADARRWSEEKMQKVGLFAGDQFFCDVYCFEPGQFQKLHFHDKAEKIYAVLEGEGRFVVGDEEVTLRPQQTIHVPAPLEHGVFNDSDARLVVLVFLSGDYPK
jgi:oxalate decarboxylase/phosphoglucose isomerase-like protein (cupin superfamily)